MIAAAGQCVGNVVLERAVSQDAMGAVWVGYHRALQRPVVIRLASTHADLDAWARLEQGGRAMARVRSQHAPQVFDQGTCADGTPFVVMELLLGMDLEAWVREHGRLDAGQAVRLLDQVGDALAAAHEAGIIHGGVRPENIILHGGAETFRAKLNALGLHAMNPHGDSRPEELEGVTSSAAGFMSPEQLLGAEHIDERADIWSLGAVMYWCLTGTRPFAGEAPKAVTAAVERGHFLPVSEARPDLSVELDNWFDRALAPEAERRFQSVALMTKLFHVATQGPLEPPRDAMTSTPPLVLALTEDLAPPPVSPKPSRNRSSRIRRGSLAMVTVGLLLLGAGAAARWNSPIATAPHAVASPPPIAVPTKPADPGWSGVGADARNVELLLSVEDASAPATAGKTMPASRVAPHSHIHTRPTRARSTTAVSRDWSPTDELGEPGERRAPH